MKYYALIGILKFWTQIIQHYKSIDFVFDLYLVSGMKLLDRQERAADISRRIVITFG